MLLSPRPGSFDEPLSNLDAKLRRKVRQEIRELQQSLNLTVAYVTHDQEEALAVSDRIIVMSNARIAQQGSPRELYEAPANSFVADFIGDANLVEVTIDAVEDGQARVMVGPICLTLPARGLTRDRRKLPSGPTAFARRRLSGNVRKSSYLGDHVEMIVATPIGELFVISRQTDQIPAAGASVNLSFAPQGIALVR